MPPPDSDFSRLLERYFDQITRWLAHRGEDAPEWRKASGFGDLQLLLTRDELERLRGDVETLVRPYVPRITGEEDAPEGARRVNLVHFAFPEPEAGP